MGMHGRADGLEGDDASLNIAAGALGPAGAIGPSGPVGGASTPGATDTAGVVSTGSARASRLDDREMRDLQAEHGVALRIVALRMCDGDVGRADDAVQEAFIRAWQHPEVLDASRGSTRGWLLTTIRRILVDAHRAREARPIVATDIVPELPYRTAAVSDVDRMLEQTVVLDALAALAYPHREAIVECYYRGSTVVEAAQRLGVPPGTVKSRLFYGLRALRSALQERGVHA
ncbi:MAG: polymerase subunit sigma [Pseudonocardiales bacterium]|nr:polymerase subunit sigma [Pseudonocardiales bacterium]